MKVVFMTHRGTVREENQDAVLVSGIVRMGDMDTPEVCGIDFGERPILLAVIDGMGGHEGGALAAKIVTETLAEKASRKDLFGACIDVNEDERVLRQIFAEAVRRMKAKALGNLRLSKMGATVSGVLLREKSALVFNCGDCRAYRFSDGNLERITRDHSIVQELFEQEEISEEEMRRHPRKNIVTSLISADLGEEFELYVREFSLCEGGSFFLCSDGVWETLPSRQLTALLAQDIPLVDLAQSLFDTLMAASCRDNVSFIQCCAGR